MKVSIVIPALDEAAAIAPAVDRAWALGPHEVLVVDGGSGDETVALAAAAGAKVLDAPPGRGTQQNAGARAASGDVLLFLHADTWVDAGALAQIEAALADPRTGAGAFRQRIEARGLPYRLLERGNAARVAWRGLPYGDQGIFVRRELFDRLGGFADVPLMEDVLLMRRARRAARVVLLAGPIHTSARRWQRRGVVRQTLVNWALVTGLALGVGPARLARWYGDVR